MIKKIIQKDYDLYNSSSLEEMKHKIIEMCLEFPNSYYDTPFSDDSWGVVRHKEDKKVFAWIFKRYGNIWINLKCDEETRMIFRSKYPKDVLPAYHLNHTHWSSVILNGNVDISDLEYLIYKSYLLSFNTKKRREEAQKLFSG